jgi:hypothetical protein
VSELARVFVFPCVCALRGSSVAGVRRGGLALGPGTGPLGFGGAGRGWEEERCGGA